MSGGRFVPLLVALFLGCATTPAHPQTVSSRFGVTQTVGLDHAMMETALGITEKLVASHGNWTVAVTNLSNSKGQFTSFGEYVGNAVDARLAGSNIRLVDRAYAQRISEEIQKCDREGSLRTCASRGQFEGANVLVVGRYEVFESAVRIFIKAVETETATVAFAKEVAVPKDSFVRELLARSGEAVSPAAEEEARKARWRKRLIWTTVISALAGGTAVGVWAATRSDGSGSSGPPPVSAGGQGETATIVISVPPPQLRR